MYIPRILTAKLKQVSRKFPIVTLMGPRQSGKTTLIKKVFSKMPYMSFEDLDTREFAIQDPRGFLEMHQQGVVLDEAQRAPELFSYIQGVVDKNKRPGQFILTGSQNFLLQNKITQSLAGRVALLYLLPFSIQELHQAKLLSKNYTNHLFKGFYPRVYEARISPVDWYLPYIQTYIERDVRQMKNVGDLYTFQKFIRLCAGRVGQLLNLSSLACDCGITHNTAKSWLSILQASFIIFLLKPYHKNFNKRLVKMPKLYFYDTGLAAALLGIEHQKQLITHPAQGSLFESLIISELIKHRFNKGLPMNCYFWRNKTGHEIDCVLEQPDKVLAIEIKSSKTIASDYFKELKYWHKLSNSSPKNSFIIYGGDDNQKRNQGIVTSWNRVSDLGN